MIMFLGIWLAVSATCGVVGGVIIKSERGFLSWLQCALGVMAFVMVTGTVSFMIITSQLNGGI